MPLSEKNIFRPFFIHRKIISFPLFLIILGFFPRIEGVSRFLYFSKKLAAQDPANLIQAKKSPKSGC